MKRKWFLLGIAMVCIFAMSGCNKTQDVETSGSSAEATTTAPTGASDVTTAAPTSQASQTIEKPDHETVKYDITDGLTLKLTAYDQWIETCDSATTITLQGDDVTVDGSGVSVEGRRILIQKEGEYVVSGELTNGQISIDAGEESKVHLILKDASLHSDFSSPIYCKTADKLIITIPEGTTSTVTDALSCEDTTAKGSIYAVCDLTINGAGTLKVIGNFNHGISTDDTLKIYGTTCEVSAVETAIRGKDGVGIIDGTITVSGAEDAIKSNRKNDTTKGFIFVHGGKLDLTADDDALQATTAIVIEEADSKARCMGKVVNCDGFVRGEDKIIKWN